MYSSSKIYRPRAFESFWKPFVRVFQVFCVSHHSIYYPKSRFHNSIYFILVSTLHITFIVYNLKNIHVMSNSEYKVSSLMYYVSFLSFVGDIVEHTVCHMEPFFMKKYEIEIYRRFEEINEIFATKLNYVTDFDAVRKRQVQSTINFFILTGIVAFGLSFFSLPEDGFSIFFHLLSRAVSITIIRLRRCQMSLLINFLSNVLLDLQILLKQQQQKYIPNSDGMSTKSSENIQYLRDIYSNVWLIKNLLSSGFGWSIITVLIDFSFDLINSSYWTYITIKTYKSTKTIIRKKSVFSYKEKRFYLVKLCIVEVVYYLALITINFGYFCMISERCQNAVSVEKSHFSRCGEAK